MPMQINPAEYILDLMNVDFSADRDIASKQLDKSFASWEASGEFNNLQNDIHSIVSGAGLSGLPSSKKDANKFIIPVTLIHRLFIKCYRDVVAYGIRIAMYTGDFRSVPSVALETD